MGRIWGTVDRLATIRTVILVGAIISAPLRALAVPIPNFTGHVEYTAVYPYVVNYAVLSPYDSFSAVLAAAYVPAPGNTGFDASKYTYLYQVANPAVPLSSFSATYGAFEPVGQRSISVPSTTVGAFASGNFRLDFLSGGAVVNANGNNLQGADTLGIAARTVSSPNSVGSNPQFSGTQFHPYWAFNVSPGFTSPLLGYQSTLGPTSAPSLLSGYIFDSGNYFIAFTSAFPSVPNAISASAPEPNAVLLIAFGLVGVLVWRKNQTDSSVLI